MTAPIALTCGEPAGIGLELSFWAWEVLRRDLDFFLIADRRHMAQTVTDLPAIEICDPSETAATMANGLPFLHHQFAETLMPGLPARANAIGVIDVIRRAVDLVRADQASAICTNPIHKKALHDGADFAFPGHTEFLAHLGGVARSVMMLTSPELRVVPATIHVALSKVPDLLTAELLSETLRITHAALKTTFAIENPRIAVAGLNPHAGEGGAMGQDEIKLIAPLIARLNAEGLNLTGPHSADTMFHAEARARYDAAVCMYHDQALIPIKTLDFHGGTNVTLGLPFIRTSPDHGTAFDLAGKGLANPSSLIAALRQAHSMAINASEAT
ncbi:MAG: 4-hydroxythreonine-4-phosphate dehydrogenase PdxA [Alphaproteobacteria bacterium]|nr:4-hydroxythreonine-4-phosphate dehydrogenase PdxA [Alphaproteobacteria bacterium]